ncbi:hypothetical protein [Melittangium boletus]|uniref:hypothetical protein n=1 Tax=Melittangium boletus TaxID=83453 RepID=UPI003DA46481
MAQSLELLTLLSAMKVALPRLPPAAPVALGTRNQMIMGALYEAERQTGRMLTSKEILDTVGFHMRRSKVPMNFVSWRGHGR